MQKIIIFSCSLAFDQFQIKGQQHIYIIINMKGLLLLFLCLAITLAQPPTLQDDSSTTDSAEKIVLTPMAMSIGTRAAVAPGGGATTIASPAPSTGYSNANSAWYYLQSLGGGCCNNCNRICGMAIRLSGNNLYLTSKGTYLQFEYTLNPNNLQIFTLGQNADCTWSFSNGGKYLSTTSPFGAYVGFANTIGTAERWYIERSGGDVYVQSANLYKRYWKAVFPPSNYASYNSVGDKLTFEFFPCDKTYGWNP